jgi:hypothetical protein
MRHWIPLTRRQVVGSLTWALISLLGWGLFVYWWRTVFAAEQPRPFVQLLLFITLICLLTLLTTLTWIWHNMRIARRGRRGMAARYRPPIYERDALGRTVIIENGLLVRSAAVVTVTASEATKTFTPQP